MAACGESADFEISLDSLKIILLLMRDLGRQSSTGIPCLDSKWYDNWDDVQNEALEMSEARAHCLHQEQDEILLLRVKAIIFWCIRGSVHGWDSLQPKSLNGSCVIRNGPGKATGTGADWVSTRRIFCLLWKTCAVWRCRRQTLQIFTGNMNGSWLRPICVKSQGCSIWMVHFKVSFLYKCFVRGLSAVVRGCPRLCGL